MSDRSWAAFEIPNVPEAIRLAEAEGFGPEWGEESPNRTSYPGGVRVVCDESSGGGWDLSHRLQNAHIPYRHHWDACRGAYGSGRGAYVPRLNRGQDATIGTMGNGLVAVRLDDTTGTIHPADLREARTYLRVNRGVEAAISAYAKRHAPAAETDAIPAPVEPAPATEDA
jgi:hypothetical protein